MDLSIIIVTWNSEKYIRNCLDSILLSSGDFKYEIILVDNASTDQTVRSVEELYPQVKLIQNRRNIGYAKANNQGMEEAQGEYLLLLNPDTEILENALVSMLQFLEENARVGALGPRLLNPDKTTQPSCREFPTYATLIWEFSGLSRILPKSKIFNRWRMGYFEFNQTREVDQPMGSCFLLRRATLQDVGLFDENFPMFFNDVDLCYRIKQAGWKIYYYPNAQVLHHKGASTLRVKRRMIWLSHVSFFKFFNKHRTGLLNRLALYLLCIPLFLFTLPRMIIKK
jgi:GT2 family glycosyltransferase